MERMLWAHQQDKNLTVYLGSLMLGDFTASIPLLNKIGNQSRWLNSDIVYEFTASIPLPRASIH